MTPRMKTLTLLAIALIVVIALFIVWRLPYQERAAADEQQQLAYARAVVLYGANCVQCHGAFGEGLNGTPALNSTTTRFKASADLFAAIQRGRPNTAMSAYGVGNGGTLTVSDINALVTLIQQGSWRSVQSYLTGQALVPTDVPPTAQLFNVAALSHPLKTVSQGWDVFRGTCMACHSLNSGLSTGSTNQAIGKQLFDNPFIKQSTDDQLLAFLKVGRSTTDPANTTGFVMPARGGNPTLTDDDLRNVIAFLRELNNGTVNLNTGAKSDTSPVGTYAGVNYQWTPFASHFDSPIGMTYAPDQSGRLFVPEQIGMILIVDPTGQINPTPFLDITTLVPLHVYDGSYTEQGLLGLAFPPNYAQSGVFYFS